MASRKIEDLHPDLQPICRKFIELCKSANLDILITTTYRSNEEQNELFASGRTKKGPILTRAKAGKSAHNFTINSKPASKAFDVVPLVDGKAQWDASHPHWAIAGKIGMDLGLNWYGRPDAPFREMPHFQNSRKIQMNLGQLYQNPATGKLSVSRLACSTAHLQAAIWFGWLTYAHGYNSELWIVYLGFATGHNIAGKVVAAYRGKSQVEEVKQ